MENKLRRGLALLMTLIMLISCAPMDALAAIVPVSGGTQTSSGVSLKSIVKPPVATHTYIFMNGTEEFARQILKNGQTLNNPGTPTADSANKEFVGWFDESGNQLTFPITASVGSVSSTITVNARFADVYFVFFTNPSGEVMVTKKGKKGDTISTEGVTYPVGNEESIVGWEDASGNLVSSVTLNGSDVTLKARVEQGHWITYDSQGGTYVAPAFVKGNETTTAPAVPIRPGYTFDHWSETVGGAAFTFGKALTTALTLYAVWTPNTRTQYTVIHWQENANDDDYSFAESETKYGTTGTQTNATAKSYTGFTLNTDDKPLVQETIAGDGSTIVNVYYKRDVYKIEFLRRENHSHTYTRRTGRWPNYTYYGGCYPTNGGTTTICGKTEGTNWNVVHTINAKWDENVTSQWPKNINGTTDWRTSQNGNTYQVSIDRMPRANKSFYDPYTSANETHETETAYYYVESLPGGTSDTTYNGKNYYLHHSDTSGGSGFNVTSDDQYEITGFTFAGGTAIDSSYNNAKFYYTRNSYNIIYINNGVQDKVVSKLYEESIADAGSYEPARPSTLPDTFTFGGWYADPTVKQAYDFTGKTMPAQNITVYAKWTEPTSIADVFTTIIGGSSETIDPIPYGGTITDRLNELQATIMANNPGYTWRGWRTGPNGTGDPFNVDTKIYSNITLYPYYTKDGTFSVTYVSGKSNVTAPTDGKKYAEDSYADLMSPDKLVSSDGQYFLGWTDGKNTYQPRDKYQIKGDVTFTGVWGARPAGTTLTYKANGGTGEDVVENLANNATVTTRPGTTFSRDGYTFKGWDTDPKGEGSIAPNTQVQVDNNDGANVLYAIWTANTDTKYTVEFYYQNTDGSYPQKANESVVRNDGTTDTTVSVTDDDKAAKDNNKYVYDESAANVESGIVKGDGSLVLKLYFKLNTASYTIHHYLNGTTVKVADDQTGTKTIGETLTANKSDALYSAYAAATVAGYAPEQTITINTTGNVITVYYTVTLTITAENADKLYDGKPLTQPDFKMEGLVNGDTKGDFSLSMTAASTITNAGNTPNVIDTDTVKYKGGAIPSYYNVSYANGTLTVNKASATVTITGVNETHVYDGKQHEANGYNYSFTGKPNEITISPNVLAIAKRTDVGTTYMGLTKDSFTVTSANYDVTIEKVIDGYVKITPVTDKVTVTVTENGAIVTYDGNEHSVKGYKSMTADNALYDVTKSVKATETAAWTATGTDAGEYPVGIAAGDFENINKNFTNVAFVIVDGVLKINPITQNTITITANSASKTYDGTPLTDNGFDYTKGVLVEGDVLTAVVEGSATNVGDEGKNVVKSYKAMRGDVDVTGNYTFTDSVDGKLTINKRTVTLTSETASKEYDGTPLTKPVVAVTGDGFVAGEVTGITATGSVTFVHEGKVTNAITFTTGEKFNEDNYTITKNEGKLTITQRTDIIVITTPTRSRAYNGKKLLDYQCTYTGTIADGDELIMTFPEDDGLINAGSKPNQYERYRVERKSDGRDVTNNYTFGESIIGTLTVTPVAIELTAASDSKQYDGTPLTKNDYKITNGAFVGEEGLASVTVVGSQTLVGSSANTITAHSLKANTLAQNYTITYQPGELKVTQNEKAITVTANSHTWEYDGQPHSDGGYTVEYDGQTYKVEAGKTATLPTGDVVKAKITKTVTNVSDSVAGNNTIDELTIVNAAGEDTKGQYKTVTLIPGTLTITKRGAGEEKVKITAADNTVEYDGQPHGAKLNAAGQIEIGTSFTVTNLAEGHSVKTLAIEGSETDAGVYADKLVPGNAVIVDGNGVEVTANYDITYVPGTLTITRRGAGDMKVVLTAANNTVVYDGQPHGAKLNDKGEIEVGTSYTITNLADGHKVQSVVISGSETAVGEYENKLVPSDAKIVDAAGNDVTKNYVVDYKNGKLTITSPDTVTVTIKGKTDTVEYNGQKHEVNGYEVVSISNTLYTEADFGFADGAAAHAEGTDAGEYPMNLTKDSFVNKNGNFTSVTFVVEDGKLTITRRGLDEKNLVKIIAAKNTVYYDGQPHGAKLNAADQIEVGTSYTTEYLAPGHKVQTVAIDGSETMVGVYEGRLVPKSAVIVDENDNDVTRNYEITYVPGTLEIKKNETEIKVTANSHTWEYDGQPHSDGGYTVNYDGVDYPVEAGEFATLPTGDVVKAKITKTVTNVSDSVADNNTIDELTIVNAAGEDTKGQYKTISLIPGTLTITKRGAGENKVTIKANDNLGVVYDGQAHGENGHTDTNLAEGHHVETVTIDGSRINVGTYKEELVPHDAKIVDTDGNDVTDNYEITYKEGDLEIVSPDTVVVTIRGNKETVEYDGTKHEVNGYEVVSISNALYTENDFGFAEGAAAHAEGVDADTYPMNLTSESFVNKSTNFATVSFIVEDGALTITKRGAGENKVTITARDNTVNYDGQPHGAKLNAAGQIEVNVSYTTEYLAPGHKVQSVAIDGSETMVGVYEGRLVPNAAIIVDENDNDVTRNYVITYVSGTLEIKKNETEIKVTANSHTWEYDGQPHSDGGYTVTYGEESYTVKADDSATLSTGDKVTAVITRKVKNVSDTADGNNEIVTLTVENESQYASIIQEAGTLTITRRPVKVTINSKINSESFTYDAAEHTVADEHGKEYTIETAAENSGLLPGHTESLNVVYDDGTTKTESRKYVGTYTADSERDENGEAVVTITKADSGEDVTANYAITVKPGTLEIAKAEIEIELIGPKSERVYNGQEQVVETTEITTDEAYAHGAEEPKTIKIVAKGLKGEDYISEGTVIHIAKGTYVGEHTGNFVWDGPHGNDEKPTVLNNDGNGNAVDVTENYTFKRTPGSLTITSDHPTQPDKEIDGHEPGTKYALGDRIYFKITVRNITLESLELVEVHDPTAVIVDGDGYTVVDEHHAKIENMPASVDGQEPATVVINAYHVVTEDDIKNIVIDSGYKYENVATITVGDKTIDARKGTNDIEDADYTLKIEKQLINRPASGEKFKLGETAKFQITVTNEGNVTQTDIPVAEKLPGAVFTEGDGYTLNADKTVATITKVLNPADKESQRGDSIVLYAQYTIKEEDLGNKNLKNIVTAPNGKPGEEPIPVDEAKSMAGQKIWNDLDNLYDTRTESVTVNLKRKAGQNGAAEQYKTATVDQSTGWRYGFDHLPAHDMQNNEFFYWVEEAPITGYEPTYEVKDDSHCDIVNNLQTYTLTIHYWQHKLGDTKMEQAFPDYVATLYYKQPYDVESPEREGIILDDMSQARISGTMPAHDLVIDVYYHRIAYRLTIHYIYQDGTMAHEDYTWTYWFNSTYNVPSPIIPGFTPSIDVIAGRMPSHGLELTVVYVGDGEIVVPDEDTSLGFKSYLNAGECFE